MEYLVVFIIFVCPVITIIIINRFFFDRFKNREQFSPAMFRKLALYNLLICTLLSIVFAFIVWENFRYDWAPVALIFFLIIFILVGTISGVINGFILRNYILYKFNNRKQNLKTILNIFIIITILASPIFYAQIHEFIKDKKYAQKVADSKREHEEKGIFTDIESALKNPRKVVKLHLWHSSQEITPIPEDILLLDQLKELDLSGYHLNNLSPSQLISLNEHLEVLHLEFSFNSDTYLNKSNVNWVYYLLNLKELSVSGSKSFDLNNINICSLKHLEILTINCHCNNIVSMECCNLPIPACLCELQDFKTLNIENNQDEVALPYCFWQTGEVNIIKGKYFSKHQWKRKNEV